MAEDFYDVLGVGRDASEDEIKQAYRRMVSEHHPDVSDADDAEETFSKIQKAKEVLTDDEKRQQYDQLGHERYTQAQKHGATGGGARQGNPFGGTGGVGDIFEQFFGGGGPGGRSGPRPGQDLRTRLTLSLQEAHDGVTKQVTVRRPERCESCEGAGYPPDADARTCPECDGQGQVTRVQQTPLGRMQSTQTCNRCGGDGELYSETCSGCSGSGQVRRQATLNVDVPPGIDTGQTLRMEREGAPGDRGAPNGDLLIEIEVEEHPDFERDGADLHHRYAVSFPQAVFGDTIQVPTLDGTSEFDLPGGTQSGETFRLRGKGMPRIRRRGHGDLYVTVQIVTPDSLNDEETDALQAFAEAGGEEIDVEDGFFEKLKNSF